MVDSDPNSALREVEHFSGEVPLAEWLAAVGLLPDQNETFNIVLHDDWRRKGAETYTMDFSIDTEGQSSRLIAKACIKLPVSATMGEWQSRRNTISTHGIQTPYLYVCERATLIEEYIPYTLQEAYLGADEDARSRMREELEGVFKTLLCLGFKPHLGGSDFRSRGEDVVLIDFGEDLGGISERVVFTEEEIEEISVSYSNDILTPMDK